jgi:hypothetical protein
VRLTAYAFEERLNNGYTNPDNYQSAEATVQSYGTIAEKLTYNVQLAGGYGWINPGTNGPLFSADGRVTYEISGNAAVSAFGSYLITYARETSVDPNAPPADESFWRAVIGGELRLRW